MTTDLLPLTDPRAQRTVAAARADAIRKESEADRAAIRQATEDAAELARVQIAGEEKLIAVNINAATVAANELMLAASHQERLRSQELRQAQPVDQADEDELTMSPKRRKLWRRGLLAFTLSAMVLLFGIIVATQLDFYRQLDGMKPTILGVSIPVYLAVPVATELLSLLYGAYATFCLYTRRGNYSKYVRWMWIYASIAAVVNASHSITHLDASDAGLTALVLGGASLASPGAWHAYIGMTLAVRRSAATGVSIIARGRRTLKHPILTRRFHWSVDVFPDLSHDEVWAMVAGAKRARLASKYEAQAKAAQTGKPKAQQPKAPKVKAQPVVEPKAQEPKAPVVEAQAVETQEPKAQEDQAQAGPETVSEETRPMPRIVGDQAQWEALIQAGVGWVQAGGNASDREALLAACRTVGAVARRDRTPLVQAVRTRLDEVAA
jgi:hypothetical protein